MKEDLNYGIVWKCGEENRKLSVSSIHFQNYHGQFYPVTTDGESRSLSMVTHAGKLTYFIELAQQLVDSEINR